MGKTSHSWHNYVEVELWLLAKKLTNFVVDWQNEEDKTVWHKIMFIKTLKNIEFLHMLAISNLKTVICEFTNVKEISNKKSYTWYFM